jgi:5-hydroxyisourate hydrolase
MKWNEAFEIASGTTNKDGRIADWRGTGVGPDAGADEGGAGDANMTADAGDVDMAVGAGAAGADATAGGGAARADATVGKGIYKIRFETRDYFDKQTVPSFYPFVDIYFEVTRDGHYHIPLLISPFGYSTYRGS